MGSERRPLKEVIVLSAVLFPLYPLIFAYMIVSSHMAGVSGFWNLFWTGYIEMFFITPGHMVFGILSSGRSDRCGKQQSGLLTYTGAICGEENSEKMTGSPFSIGRIGMMSSRG